MLYPFGQDSGLTEEERAVLLDGGADLEEHPPEDDDPVRRAVVEHAAVLASALTTAEAARRLGVSEMRIRQRLTNHSLLGVQTSRGWRIPSFQFSRDGELPGWDHVARAIPADVAPGEVLSWLDLPHPDLRRGRARLSPRAWLAAGRDPAAVAAAAEDFVNR